MTRSVFYSFHYEPDNWRASQVRNIGVIEGNPPCADNDWESIKRGGEDWIKRWIAGQMDGKSCAVVLIGSNTAGRKWIEYEIEKAWNGEKGLVGIYIHNLKNREGRQSIKGANPFDRFTLKSGTVQLSSIVKAYDPPFAQSTLVYAHIQANLASWVEEAIRIRSKV